MVPVAQARPALYPSNAPSRDRGFRRKCHRSQRRLSVGFSTDPTKNHVCRGSAGAYSDTATSFQETAPWRPRGDRFRQAPSPPTPWRHRAHADAPRGIEFLYGLNRVNVATSRAICLSILVASLQVLEADCRSPPDAAGQTCFAGSSRWPRRLRASLYDPSLPVPVTHPLHRFWVERSRCCWLGLVFSHRPRASRRSRLASGIVLQSLYCYGNRPALS
jgi:hypothetical protein